MANSLRNKIKHFCYKGYLSERERDRLLNALDDADRIKTELEPSWIPCSERLPEICEKDCRGNITFSEAVLSTQIYGDGYAYVGIDQYTTNNGGGWLMEVPFDNPEECCKVIAWMPLPEPYKAESEDKE